MGRGGWGEGQVLDHPTRAAGATSMQGLIEARFTQGCLIAGAAGNAASRSDTYEAVKRPSIHSLWHPEGRCRRAS